MADNKGGRPLKYSSPEEFDAICGDYIETCTQDGVFPDEAGMCLFAGISWDTKNRYEKNEDGKYGGFAEVLKKYSMIRESYLTRAIFNNPKFTGGAAFLLKQPKNGGYADKQQIDTSSAVKIEFAISGSGAGGSASGGSGAGADNTNTDK